MQNEMPVRHWQHLELRFGRLITKFEIKTIHVMKATLPSFDTACKINVTEKTIHCVPLKWVWSQRAPGYNEKFLCSRYYFKMTRHLVLGMVHTFLSLRLRRERVKFNTNLWIFYFLGRVGVKCNLCKLNICLRTFLNKLCFTTPPIMNIFRFVIIELFETKANFTHSSFSL